MSDNINNPNHYTQGKIECIEYIIDKNFNFSLGSAVKYITRAGLKEGNSKLQDLRKAAKYIEFEIECELNKDVGENHNGSNFDSTRG